MSGTGGRFSSPEDGSCPRAKFPPPILPSPPARLIAPWPSEVRSEPRANAVASLPRSNVVARLPHQRTNRSAYCGCRLCNRANASGKTLSRTAPYGQVGYDIRDLNHVPRRLQKTDERGLIKKLWLEFHRRWPTEATMISDDMLGPSKKAATPAAQTGPPNVDAEDVLILRALKAAHPHRLTQDQIEANSRVSRKTISQRMKDLLASGLVSQPKGPRSGTVITESGLNLLKQLEAAQGTR
jgi:hypothetical protein